MVAISRPTTLTFEGGAFLRHRLVLSTLSNRPVRVTDIRADDDQPGLSPAEISFIRLLDKLTTGTTIEINETGTALFYKPGLLLGGERLAHACHASRATAYYLQPLLMLAPFCKRPLRIALHGPTHAAPDPCADTVAAVSVPLLRRLTLGAPLAPSVDVRRRAAAGPPAANGGGAGGLTVFSCGLATAKLRPVDLVAPGFVRRVRGLAFANRTSPALVARVVDAARGALNGFTPDVYVHTDHGNKGECGVGFGLQVAAETTEGCLLGADWVAVRPDVAAESVARDACRMLLEEIAGGGCVDSGHVCLALLYCALADCDVSRVRVGRLSEAAVEFMRDLQRFFGVVFSVKVVQEDSDSEDEGAGEQGGERAERKSGGGIVLTCVGVGLTNVARQRF